MVPPMFIRRYEQIDHGKDISDVDICLDRLKNMAVVNFQIGSEIMQRIKRSQRVTFADTLSNIGE